MRLPSVQQKPPAKIFTVDDSVSAFLRPFAQYLADGLNHAPDAVAQVPPECAEIRIYAINWLDDDGQTVLNDVEERCSIVWHGSRQNVLVDGLEKYFRVWASSPLLYSYLRTAKVETAYVPLFAFPADYKAENNTGGEKFWAIIGQDAMAEEALKAEGLPLRRYDFPAQGGKFIRDLPHIAAVFTAEGNLAESVSTLDVHPALFAAVAAGVPIAARWIWPFEKAINLFNDTIFYYATEENVHAFAKAARQNAADIRQRTGKAAELVQREFAAESSRKRALASVMPAHANDGAAATPLNYSEKANSLSIDIPTAIGHYTAGDYALASDLASNLERKGFAAAMTFYNSLYKYPTETAIIMRGFVPLIADDISARRRILYLAYAQFGEKDGREDVPSQADYLQTLAENAGKFDALATASLPLAEALRQRGVAAYYVPQYTNTARFYADYDEKLKSEVLFVGTNSFYRTAVPALLKRGIAVDVYGPRWPAGVAKAPYADNRILRKYYSSAKIVLNDTREGMKKFGFISNRIFDATACGTMVISDYMPEIEAIYGDSVPMYKNGDELAELVHHYLAHDDERRQKAARAREITLKYFTADKAAADFLEIIRAVRK